MTDATAAAAPHRQSKLPDVGGFHGKLVQHIFAYAHGLNTVEEAEWVAKVPRLLCRDGWPHASVVAPGAAHRARVARTAAARAALAMQVPRAKLLRAACLNPLYAWLGGRQCFVRHVDLTQIPDFELDVVLPPHLETDETDRLDRYVHRGRAGFLADMDLVASNAAAFVSDTDPATRAVADEAAAIARAAQTACDAGEAPVAAAAPADDAAWALKRPIALQTLDVLAVTVAGRADLEAKIGELRALMEGAPPPAVNGVAAPVAEVNGAAAPAADIDPSADYTPYFSKDTGYTIWLNKKNPRNSYYEYPDKKKK